MSIPINITARLCYAAVRCCLCVCSVMLCGISLLLSPPTRTAQDNQSKNPHNDYAQHFVDTGERSQNFIHDASVEDRFEEYPKLKELIQRKDEHIDRLASPPMLAATVHAQHALLLLQACVGVSIVLGLVHVACIAVSLTYVCTYASSQRWVWAAVHAGAC